MRTLERRVKAWRAVRWGSQGSRCSAHGHRTGEHLLESDSTYMGKLDEHAGRASPVIIGSISSC